MKMGKHTPTEDQKPNEWCACGCGLWAMGRAPEVATTPGGMKVDAQMFKFLGLDHLLD